MLARSLNIARRLWAWALHMSEARAGRRFPSLNIFTAALTLLLLAALPACVIMSWADREGAARLSAHGLADLRLAGRGRRRHVVRSRRRAKLRRTPRHLAAQNHPPRIWRQPEPSSWLISCAPRASTLSEFVIQGSSRMRVAPIQNPCSPMDTQGHYGMGKHNRTWRKKFATVQPSPSLSLTTAALDIVPFLSRNTTRAAVWGSLAPAHQVAARKRVDPLILSLYSPDACFPIECGYQPAHSRLSSPLLLWLLASSARSDQTIGEHHAEKNQPPDRDDCPKCWARVHEDFSRRFPDMLMFRNGMTSSLEPFRPTDVRHLTKQEPEQEKWRPHQARRRANEGRPKPIGLPGRHGALRAHRSMLSEMPLASGNCKERPESALNGDAEMALHLVPTVSTCLG